MRRARAAAAAGRWTSLTPEELAQMLYQALMNGDEAMMRALARQAVQPLRRDGAGPARRRHLLPLPHAAEPRPRRHAREADGGHPPAGRRRADRARGAARARRVRDVASSSSRRRSRPRSAGGWWPTAASRPWPRRCASRCPRTSTSCTPVARRDAGAAQGALPAHPQARRPPRPQAPPRSQGPARLPQHGAPLAVLRRRAGRAEVQVPAPGEARADGGGRHLGFGRRLRPLHPAPRLRHPGPVLEGALVRLHRRHRRGHRATSRASRTSPRPCTGSTPRPTWCGSTATPTTATPSRCSGSARAGRRPEDDRAAPRRRPEQLPRRPVVGASRRCATRPATSTGSTPSPARTGTPATRSSASTASTPTACTSAATSASSRGSSRSSPEHPRRDPPRARSATASRRPPSTASSAAWPTCTGLSDLGRRQAAALRDRWLTARRDRRPTSSSPATCPGRSRRPRSSRRPWATCRSSSTPACGEHEPGPTCDGLTWDEAIQRYGSPDWELDPYLRGFPGGETLAAFQHRAAGALAALVRRHEGRVVVAVCHARRGRRGLPAVPPPAVRRGVRAADVEHLDHRAGGAGAAAGGSCATTTPPTSPACPGQPLAGRRSSRISLPVGCLLPGDPKEGPPWLSRRPHP